MMWLAIAFGGALGAMARYAIALKLAGSAGRFPIATFVTNGLGCFLMGLGFVLIVERALLPEVWRHVILIGMLGAFTTFSTFSIESLSLIQIGAWKMAGLYIGASVVGSLVAVAAGVGIAKTFF